ncbi:MAG: Gfo/Idh/MocA family oxidoreductase [Treponema sp.]|jgi:predicted dehydrogenase|nr:Gfo/Idh/MocA family oxidoreductase [Treponema sp.]
MLNVGLISTWHVHTKGYVQELQKSGKVHIAALWDENPGKGREAAGEWKADFEENFDAFISRKDFSAVICNAPTTMHPLLLSKAAAAGKDIFTEKLLAVTTTDAEALAQEFKKRGIIFTISLPFRGNPAILYVKQLVDSGALGRITAARCRLSHGGVSDGWLPDYWFDTSLTGGGAMMDLGAHPVYILSFLFGMPKRVSGMCTRPFGTSSDENAVGLAEFKDGILATMETAFITFGVPDILEVYGSEGSVFMQGGDLRLNTKAMDALSLNHSRPKTLPEARPSPILQFVEACINRSGTPEYLGPDDAVLMTRIIEAVYQSDNSGRTISL